MQQGLAERRERRERALALIVQRVPWQASKRARQRVSRAETTLLGLVPEFLRLLAELREWKQEWQRDGAAPSPDQPERRPLTKTRERLAPQGQHHQAPG